MTVPARPILVVSVVKGDVAVSRAMMPGRLHVTTDEALFDDIASGRENALAALLRGAVSIEGDPELLDALPAAVSRASGAHGPARNGGRCREAS